MHNPSLLKRRPNQGWAEMATLIKLPNDCSSNLVGVGFNGRIGVWVWVTDEVSVRVTVRVRFMGWGYS